MSTNIDGTNDEFHIEYLCNISGEEKLCLEWVMTRATAGAGTAPDRSENTYKFVPSPDTDCERIDLNNTGTGDFATDMNISVIGTD